MKQSALILLLFAVVYLFFSPGLTVPYGQNHFAGKYYNIRGFKMYCEVYGKGQPVLMIHGNNGSISSFANNIPYFARRYQVIVADSRAQGKSIDKQDSLTFEMMADDEAALLDALHIKTTHVIGWSDGGIIALLLAMRHPEKVNKIASSGANLRPDTTAMDANLWKDERDRYNKEKNNILNPEQKNEWKIFLMDYMQPHISLSQINKISCPALIISGDHDLIPVAHTKQIQQNIPGSVLWIVTNSGHATLVEHKDEFNKRVDDFFKGRITN